MAESDIQTIRKGLGHLTMKWRPKDWLNTKIPDLNRVLGHKDKGLSYGRMIEISGWESQGKSAIMMAIAALGQYDGAHIIWGDVENSFEPDWAIQRGFAKCPKCNGKLCINNVPCKACECEGEPTGLDLSMLTLIRPYVGTFGDEKNPRLSSAQELCEEIELAMKAKRKATKSIVVLDSIAALLTAGEAEAGITGSNMRTNMDLPMFMGRLLRRWVGLAQVHNAIIILVNQLRQGPAKFGDPSYTPGGNAPRFYSHVRVRVQRVAGSKIMDKGEVIGIKGVMKCKKNKTGGSEGAEVGYKLMYRGPIQFVPAKEVKKKEDGGKAE